MPYLSVSSRATVCTPSTLDRRLANTSAICARHGTWGIDQVVREMHEEGLVTHDRTRAKDGVPEPKRRRLPDIDAVRVRRHDFAHRAQELSLALGFELLLELMVAVEVILDCPLGVARDEHELARTRCERLLGRVLDQRLVDDRQHLLRAGLRGRQKAGAASGHGKHRRLDLRH
jgi:hypothetical protein